MAFIRVKLTEIYVTSNFLNLIVKRKSHLPNLILIYDISENND